MELTITEEPIYGARVSVRTGPNSQRGPIWTNEAGRFGFDHLPSGRLQLLVSATGVIERTLTVETLPEEGVTVDVPLKLARAKEGKIRVKGLEVSIADQAVFLVEATGEQLTLEQYRQYTRRRFLEAASSRQALREIGANGSRCRAFLAELRHNLPAVTIPVFWMATYAGARGPQKTCLPISSWSSYTALEGGISPKKLGELMAYWQKMAGPTRP